MSGPVFDHFDQSLAPANNWIRAMAVQKVTYRAGEIEITDLSAAAKKAEDDLNWRPDKSMQSGLGDTIRWYLANRQWWESRLRDHRMDQRLGLRRSAAAQPETSAK